MIKVCLLCLSVSLLAMFYATNRRLAIVALHIIVALWAFWMIHDYGEGKYIRGIYTATHLQYYPLERGGK